MPDYCFKNILEVEEEADDLRYQTVFAKNEGSVAAPTASLHFTKEILDNLKASGVETAKVNLHVGAGTFKPISDSIESHEMHKEMFLVPLDELDKLRTLENIIAVGTTSVRTLESLYILAHDIQSGKQTNLSTPLKVEQWSWKTQNSLFNSYEEAFDLLYKECIRQGVNKIHGYTSLMIIPGFKFRVIKGLITNFHMPKSTLLLLVAALIGDSWKTVYDFALNHDYRFLSYGDSSLLIP